MCIRDRFRTEFVEMPMESDVQMGLGEGHIGTVGKMSQLLQRCFILAHLVCFL